MDAIDRKILNLLQQNAKLNSTEIGKMIGLSQSPTYERIKKLEKAGYIEGYYAQVNRKKINKNLVVFCELSLASHSVNTINQFEKQIQKIESIMECHHLAGSKDYLLKIIVQDIETYQKVLSEQLASIPNISQINSAFVLNEIKNSSTFEL